MTATGTHTVKALVQENPGDAGTVLREVQVAAPGPGAVRIALIHGGICHTDLAMLKGALGEVQGYQISYPVVLGHEFLGRVVDVGTGVTTVAPGDRVVGSGHLTCRTCRWCLAGRSMLCLDRRTIGIEAPGAWAEEFILPAVNLVTVPSEVPDRLAALAEPFAVAARAVDVASPNDGERIAVIGPGTVGQLIVAALRGHDVTVIGRPDDRDQLLRCRTLGASHIRSTTEELENLSDRFDVVIEAAGRGTAVSTGVGILAPGARMVVVGVTPDTTTFDSTRLVLGERSLTGSRSYDLSTWQTLPSRLAAAPELEGLVSHVVSFDQLDEGLALIETRAATKVLLTP